MRHARHDDEQAIGQARSDAPGPIVAADRIELAAYDETWRTYLPQPLFDPVHEREVEGGERSTEASFAVVTPGKGIERRRVVGRVAAPDDVLPPPAAVLGSTRG